MRRDVTFSPHVFRSNVADATTLRLDLRLDQSRDLNEGVSNGGSLDYASLLREPAASQVYHIPPIPVDHSLARQAEVQSSPSLPTEEILDQPESSTPPPEEEHDSADIEESSSSPTKELTTDSESEEHKYSALHETSKPPPDPGTSTVSRYPARVRRAPTSGTSHEMEAQSRYDQLAKRANKSLLSIDKHIDTLKTHEKHLVLMTIANIDDEPTFDQAMAGPNRDLWRTAMEEEISAQEENGTWVIEKPPKGAEKIGSRWVLKRKRNRRGYVLKYKGRIVAKGCSQIEGVHFGETFAPTLRMQSLRIILAYAAYKGWSLRQLDVKTAFLIPTLPDSEVIYMTPPPIVEVPEGMALT